MGGSLDLFQTQYGVSIIGTLKGLPTGQHGLAVHEGTSCQEPGLVYKVLTLVAVITVYFFRVFGSTLQKYTRIYSILLGVH